MFPDREVGSLLTGALVSKRIVPWLFVSRAKLFCELDYSPKLGLRDRWRYLQLVFLHLLASPSSWTRVGARQCSVEEMT